MGILSVFEYRNAQGSVDFNMEQYPVYALLCPLGTLYRRQPMGKQTLFDRGLGMVCNDVADDVLVLAQYEMGR